MAYSPSIHSALFITLAKRIACVTITDANNVTTKTCRQVCREGMPRLLRRIQDRIG